MHHRVAKESPRVGKEHYLLKPFCKMLRGCFSPLSGFNLSVSRSSLQQGYCVPFLSFFLPPHFPSPHRMTCAPVRSSHYFTWQGGFKSVLLSPWFFLFILFFSFLAFRTFHIFIQCTQRDWSNECFWKFPAHTLLSYQLNVFFHPRCLKDDLDYSSLENSKPSVMLSHAGSILTISGMQSWKKSFHFRYALIFI